MFQGLWFLCKFGWKSEKRYILYNMFYQLIQSILPLIAVAVPKYILNELLGAQRLEKIILYISILAGCTFLRPVRHSIYSMADFHIASR